MRVNSFVGIAQIMRSIVFQFMLMLLLVGCGPTPVNRRLFHFDEPLRPADLELFIDIATALPESKLLSNINPFLPPPKWDEDRTLPVRELVNGELQSLDERWQHCALGERAAQSKAIERILKRKHVSRERFVSLAFAIGMAAALGTVPDDFDVNWHLKRAQVVVMDLRRDGRPFHALTPEVGYEVTRRSAWLTEYHRGERLSHVPPYNVQLVTHYRDRLKEILPADFFVSPYNTNLDRNADRALPFEDLPGQEGLEFLSWDPAIAIKGSDDVTSRK